MSEEEKQAIVSNPPDILLTNYVMLELILTRPHEHKLIHAAKGLKFLILDELHTYRGVFGSHFANVLRRLHRICAFYGTRPQFLCASATIANPFQHALALLDLAEPHRLQIIDKDVAKGPLLFRFS